MLVDRTDLNKLVPDGYEKGGWCVDGIASVEICMRGVQERVVNFINQFDVIIGCMAWLTNKKIIEALMHKKASIIVQKEDFLRPDSESSRNYKKNLREMYSRLEFYYDRFEAGIGHLSYCGDPTIEGVRCAGVYREAGVIYPKMHHKFIVGCTAERDYDEINGYYSSFFVPQKVLTGSFNFSGNGVRSLENVVIINDERIAQIYCDEWEKVMEISEPLNWASEYVDPQWRDGS